MKFDATSPTNLTQRKFLTISAATAFSVLTDDPLPSQSVTTPSILASGNTLTQKCTNTLVLSGCDWFIHEDNVISDTPAQLSQTDASENGWIPAQVPGNI